MPGWMNYKLKSDCWKKGQQPQICRWYHSNGRKWRGTKVPLDEAKRREWKNWIETHNKNKKTTTKKLIPWHLLQTFHEKIEGKRVETVTDFIFLGSKITVDGDWSHEIKHTHWKGSYEKPRQNIKKQRHHFANKGPHSESYGFSRSHVQMWVLDHKEDWALKNSCFWIVVLEKTLESPLDYKEIKPVNPKGLQPRILIGRTNAEAPILWLPDAKDELFGKDPDAGKYWRQKEKGVVEDEKFRCLQRLNGHEFEQTLKDSGGQRNLACGSPWCRKELDTNY